MVNNWEMHYKRISEKWLSAIDEIKDLEEQLRVVILECENLKKELESVRNSRDFYQAEYKKFEDMFTPRL